MKNVFHRLRDKRKHDLKGEIKLFLIAAQTIFSSIINIAANSRIEWMTLVFLIDLNVTGLFLVTLIEILPKEKKQKEEKSIVLGQASVDMMSMLRGLLFELHFSGKLSAAFAC